VSSTRFEPPVPSLEKVAPDGSTVVDPDGFIEPGENDYSSSSNKKTLRSYISSLTKGRVPTAGVVEYNGPIPTHENAYSLSDTSSPDESYAGGDNEIPDYSNSGFFDGRDEVTLKSIINKGKSGQANGKETLSGHLLLRGVKGVNDTGTPSQGGEAYKRAIPVALSNTNISAPGSNHDITAGVVTVADGRSGLGKSPGPASERVGIEDLKNVAINMLLAASGKDPIFKDGDVLTDLGAEIRTGGTPSFVQVGTSRISVNDLSARNSRGVQQINSTTSGDLNPLQSDDGVGESTYSNSSYGVVYNPLERFDSAASAVTTFGILAAGASVIVTAVAGVAAGIASLDQGGSASPIYPNLIKNEEKFLEPGKFAFKSEDNFLDTVNGLTGLESDILDALNFYKPTNGKANYSNCVIVGFSSLLGAKYEDEDIIDTKFSDKIESGPPPEISVKLNIYGTIAAKVGLRIASLALTSDKSYYLNLFRGIIKQSEFLVRSNLNDLGSLLTTNTISALTGTRIIRFVNTLAKIGDLIFLQAIARGYYRFNDSKSDFEKIYENTFEIDTKTATRFAEQRVKGARFGSKRGSSLGVSQLPSAHLVPDQYSIFFGSSIVNSYASDFKNYGQEGFKLSPERAAAIEGVLNSEYMPFYFQDLRTNEIIAFHAFLEDLSDSYSANYNSTSGYGRIEDVKTYKDTKRSVGCTFQLIATNPDDFDYMWWQINKLTTMVYPQWSKGRDLQAEYEGSNFKFTQPFSQIPTATPVIRIRVGDLIRSNYSRFNLKRLFGYLNQNSKPSSIKIKVGIYPVVGGGVPIWINSFITPIDFSRVDDGDYLPIPHLESGKIIQVKRSDYEILSSKVDTTFYEQDKNSIVRSFESSMGFGLAAVVTQLQFTWMDGLWGAGEDGPGKRAPRSCKIQMSFEPIHDIAPGLDYQGLNRAPIYPVGSLVGALTEGDEIEQAYGKGRPRLERKK
jgi:hypothetical protein